MDGGDVVMTIAEVSQKFDISADTLRYYERIGLIPPVPRSRATKAASATMMRSLAGGSS